MRWRDHESVVHQASEHNNLTLCELDKRFTNLLTVIVEEATNDPVTCIGCIGYPTWKDYPIQ